MCNTSTGSKIKKFYILAVLGIIVMLILHLINWTPLASDHSKLSKKMSDHSNYHSYNCSRCEDWAEEQEVLNREGAAIWADTITSCVLMALAGAMVYGVGCIVEAMPTGKPTQSPTPFYQQQQ